MLSECISSWSVLQQHNNLFTICSWPRIWPKEEEKKKTHLTVRDYGCSYSSSHCGSTTGRVWGGRQACTSLDEEWTRLVEGQVPCGRGCAGTQMETPGKLGGLYEQPRASHPYLCCECCSWTGSGTCSKQIQATSKSTEGGQHKAANQGRRRLDFHLPISAAWLPNQHKQKSLCSTAEYTKNYWEMSELCTFQQTLHKTLQ